LIVLAWEALRGALLTENLTPDDWRVEPIHKSRPEAFDLVPPEQGALSVEDAWQITYALHRQPNVVDAEPSFTILQDNTQRAPEERAPESAVEGAAEAAAPAGAADSTGNGCKAPDSVDERQFDWSPQLIMAFKAWDLEPPPGGERRGKGIRIGHPDSGFIRHPELFDPATGEPNRVLANLGHDFVDDDPNAENPDGDHGLGTASVLMSTERVVLPDGFVTGVAPEAEIVPLRVAKKRFLIPVPVLFESGMNRLRKAIYYAVDEAACHVISISMGWLKNKGVHEAVKYAVGKNVIVVSAAGNLVPFVVWPAAYPEVIAVAGCTSARKKWSGSSHGREVSVTGPARNVWKATVGPHRVEQSDGTSFATPSTAGIAALWLGFHGRDALIQRYGGEFKLATVFRWVLEEASDPPPADDDGEFGKGIVNACRTLSTALPALEELRTTTGSHLLERFAAAAPSPVATAGIEALARAFPNMPRPVLEERLGRVFPAPSQTEAVADLGSRFRGVGEELVFQIATSPELRRAVFGDQPSPPSPSAVEIEALPSAEEVRGRAVGRFSRRLRGRMG
jgi:thermitase